MSRDSGIFRFKKFSVAQDRCAMKIGTDAVLLGALLDVSTSVIKAFEIGTGTGVVSLMLAQRFDNLQLEGIEIQQDAFEQSESNFKESSWSSRLKMKHGDFLNSEIYPGYDLIFSNPPYFSKSLKPEQGSRSMARHLSHEDLLKWSEKSASLLTNDGFYSLITPLDAFIFLQSNFQELILSSMIKISSFPDSEPIRVISTWTKNNSKIGLKESSFHIYQSEGVYSEMYKNALSNFLIIF